MHSFSIEQIFNMLPVNIYWTDKDNVYMGCNIFYAKVHGLHSIHEIVGKRNRDFFTEKCASKFDKNNLDIMQTGVLKVLHEEIELSEEQRLTCLSKKLPLYNQENSIVGVLGISIDITDLTQQQEALKIKIMDKELPLEHILSHMPGHVYWKNMDGIYLGCNDIQARTIGIASGKNVIGKTDFDLFECKEIPKKCLENDLRIITTGITEVIEETITVDCKEVTYLSTKAPLKNKDGEIVGILGVSVDITKQKEIEAKLTNANQNLEIANNIKSKFLENIRHDIRTPLSGIVNLAELLRYEQDPERIKEYADSLGETSQELSHFLNKVLESINIMTGQNPLLKKKFGLKKILQQVVKLYAAKASEKQISVNFSYAADVPEYLLGDPGRIYRIVLELLGNALKFTAKGAVDVTVKLHNKKGRDINVIIIIEDSGIGIPPNKQQELFIRFNRLNPAYQSTYKGLGLGLSIVKQFLDELEGEIYVESTGSDSGSKFSCFIPFKESVAEGLFEDDIEIDDLEKYNSNVCGIKNKPLIPETATIVSLENKRAILLVEDHMMVAYAEKAMLAKLSCQVDHAEDGKTAIELAKQTRYDLIFMDIGLPDLDGYEVTKEIRRQEMLEGGEQRVPIIALTAHVDSESHQSCIDVGMDAVLNKPLTMQIATDILAKYIKVRG
jgi:two-component system aerobic respiration control sensor histidine kinase ArcB